MKITNITNQGMIPQTLKVLIGKKSGIDTPIMLKPGEVVYGEVDITNKSIMIYERKGYLDIQMNEKPINGIYYKPFFETTPVEEPTKEEIEVIENFFEKLVENQENSNFELSDIAENNFDELLSKDVSKQKKGKGRPKGTTKPKENKPKKPRGRPKGAKNKKSSLKKAKKNDN